MAARRRTPPPRSLDSCETDAAVPSLLDLLAFTRDQPRVAAYLRAIRQTVTPDDVVLDLGAGLGVFSVAAALAGARRVLAVEAEPVAGAIEALAAANGVADRVHVVPRPLREAEPPERATVCIYDDLHVLDLCGACAGAVADARARWLLPEARFLPDAVELWCAPVRVSLPAVGAAVAAAMNTAPLRETAAASPHLARVSPGQLAAPPVRLARVALAELDGSGVRARKLARAPRAARITGVAAWLRLALARGITLDTGPLAPATAYPHAVFPLAGPVRAAPGERVAISLRYAAPRAAAGWHRLWRWQVQTRESAAEASSFAALEVMGAG